MKSVFTRNQTKQEKASKKMSFKLNNIEQAIKIKKTFSAIESIAEYAKRNDSLINAVNTDL